MTVNNVFVLGLNDQQRGALETVGGPDELRFYGLLDYETLVFSEHYVLNDLLDKARAELAKFDGPVHAIVAHWDFPTSVLAPILCAERDIPSPNLRSVLMCEHKYWSRLAQRECVPECVPRFSAFDPFSGDALESIDLKFPFWVKPIKSHSSQLGFEINNPEDFGAALIETQENIGRVGDAFDEALAMVKLPSEVRAVTGNMCLAEEIITGTQAAPEGSMFNGEFTAHGVFDMHKDEEGHSFDRLDYPASSVAPQIQQRMIEITERYIRHIGFDNGSFNAEFMWDEGADKLWLIEVNTRISQSHSDLFIKVDGTSNHEIAIDIALARRPLFEPRQGEFAVAAKCMVGQYEDGTVQKVPDRGAVSRVQRRFPKTVVQIEVEPGDVLSELPNQDGYRYNIATLYMGADSTAELESNFSEASEMLKFEFAGTELPARKSD